MKDRPDTRFVAMSGSIMKNSLKDFAHIITWCLKGGAPVPWRVSEIAEWAEALDEKLGNGMTRRSPGVLLRFASKSDWAEVGVDESRAARRGFRRRFIATPGVVATQNEQVDCKLRITAIEYDVDDITEEHFEKLRGEWMTPQDYALTLAPEVWRVANELALGLNYEWDPVAPLPWRMARKAWAAFAREVLSESHTLDSELQVKIAIRRGDIPEGKPILQAWEAIEKSFTINPKPRWHDDTAIDLCVKWMKKAPGIVWTHHTRARRTPPP